MDSILSSVKKMLGISEEYKAFDVDIIMHINSVLSILSQLGAGPPNGFSITGDSETWSDFASDGNFMELIKSYVFLKVKLLFDPPVSSSVIESMNRLIVESEWRINSEVDYKEENQNGTLPSRN